MINFIKSRKFLAIIDQLIYSATNFLLMIFLARSLSIVDFGKYSSLVITSLLFITIANSLIINPFQVSFSKIDDKKLYYNFLFQIQIVFSFILIVVFYFSYLIFNIQIGENVSLYTICYFLFTILLFDFFRKFYLGINSIYVILLLDVFYSICMIGLFFWYKNNMNLSNVLMIQATVLFISSILAIYVYRKNLANKFDFKTYFPTQFQTGKWYLGVSALQWFSSNFFVVVSGLYLGLAALGAFRFIQSLFGVLNVLFQTIENYFLPFISKTYSDSKNKSIKFLSRLSFKGILIYIFFGIFIFIFSKEIIVLCGGSKYLEFYQSLYYITILYLFILISYPFRIFIRIELMNKQFFIAYLISFVFSLLSFHFLLKNFNINGAILGLILNQFLMILYWNYVLSNKNIYLWKLFI